VRTDVIRILAWGLLLGTAFPVVAAQNPGDAGDKGTGGQYGAALSRVYFAHQRLLAVRDACAQAFPAQAKAGEKAYAGWRTRHQKLIDELDARVTMMIRGSAKDEKEYMRNIGKYEGSILEYRNTERDELLAQPRDGMEQGCADFRNYLSGSGSDFLKEYADELRALRQRKLPK
jgi:hypothetical protein